MIFMEKKNMFPSLHKVLTELDERVIDVDDYFSWSEEEKEALIFYIGKCFHPVIQQGDKHKQFLMASIWKVIKEAEAHDEFEQADIMSRCLMHLEEGHW